VAGGGSSQNSGSFTYTVNGDGTFTIQPGTAMGTALTGGRAGQTSTTTGQPAIKGHISKNGMTLTGGTDTPSVETIMWSNGDTFDRICHRSQVLISLQ
jgi:hypothetical protein